MIATIPSGRGKRRLAIVVVGSVFVSVVASTAVLAWLAGSASKNRVMSNASSVGVTAFVERRDLVQTIELRGFIEAGEQRSAAAWTPIGAERSVVTDVFVSPLETVSSGNVLIEVSGRPLILLTGNVPLFRSLRPQDEGTDVRWLQELLNSLGYSIKVDGYFGSETEATLREWYGSLGYKPPQPDQERAGNLLAAQAALREAEQLAGNSDGGIQPNQLSRLRAEVAAASLAAGAWLPIEEVLVTPASTARITSVAMEGTEVADPAQTIVAVELTPSNVVARATVAEIKSIVPGSHVQLVAPDTDQIFGGVVDSIGEFRAGDASVGIPPGYDLQISFGDGSEHNELEVGRSVQVRVQGSKGHTTSLAVPITAVREDSSGFYVERILKTASQSRWHTEEVRVELGILVDGWFEILHEPSGGLAEGDELVVSR